MKKALAIARALNYAAIGTKLNPAFKPLRQALGNAPAPRTETQADQTDRQ